MMFSCSEEAKALLEKWAEEEGRSTSNVIERIVNEAITTKYSIEITTKPYQRIDSQKNSAPPGLSETDIPSLVRENMAQLKNTGVKNLSEIAAGKILPSVTDFAMLAAELGLSEQQQREVWASTFTQQSKKEGTTNGCT